AASPLRTDADGEALLARPEPRAARLSDRWAVPDAVVRARLVQQRPVRTQTALSAGANLGRVRPGNRPAGAGPGADRAAGAPLRADHACRRRAGTPRRRSSPCSASGTMTMVIGGR